MMVLFFALVTPFILFIGGAYIFQFPPTLGLLYAFNFAIMYFVIWSLVNQCTKIFTQTITLADGVLKLARKQIFNTIPILRDLDLQIPVVNIEDIHLQQTRIGYFLSIHFEQNGKTMGVDLDLNPLRGENKIILEQALKLNPQIKVDEVSGQILDKYNNEVLSWKGSYTLSFFVVALALVIFLVISIMLGSKI